MESIKVFNDMKVTGAKPIKGCSFNPTNFFSRHAYEYSQSLSQPPSAACSTRNENNIIISHTKNEESSTVPFSNVPATLSLATTTYGTKESKSSEENSSPIPKIEVQAFFRSSVENREEKNLIYFRRSEPYIVIDSYTKDKVLEQYLTYSKDRLYPLSFSFGQKHYCFDSKGLLKFPCPILLSYDDFSEHPKHLSKKFALIGVKPDDIKGLITTDRYLLRRFNGIMGDMIGQFLKRLVGGPPVSLSVKIFEPKSTLQRCIDAWSFAPIYLKKASSPDISPLERIKLVTTFVVSGLILTCKQIKPFNPLIGETFQGKFKDGTMIYAEHIGHYPTLSRFLITDIDNDYILHCCLDLEAVTNSMGGELIITQKGNITIDFPKLKEKVVYRMPGLKLENCRSEKERNCYIIDYLEMYDIKNQLKSVVNFAFNSKKKLDFLGAVVNHQATEKEICSEKERKLTSSYMETYRKFQASQDKIKFSGSKGNEFKLPLSQITGTITNEILFDSTKYWNFVTNEGCFAVPCQNVLPSDSRFREDLIWLYNALYYSRNKEEYDLFIKYAQGWKTDIELLQRKERDIRIEFNKKLAKNK